METFISRKDFSTFSISNKKGLSISFSNNGALSSISYKNLMLNLFEGNPIDDSIANIYIRIHVNSRIVYASLFGPNSKSSMSISSNSIEFKGHFGSIFYKCACFVDEFENNYFWKISLLNTSPVDVNADLVYVQDIGIADKNAIKLNEAYIGQYIDHHILCHRDFGFLIASRQNQPQSLEGRKVFPWIMHGGQGKIEAFLTDGFQFYGTACKLDNSPIALKADKLASFKRQYELSMAVLQTEIMKIAPGARKEFTFYGAFQENHEEASSEKDLERIPRISATASKFRVAKDKKEISLSSSIFASPAMLQIEELNDKDIDVLFGKNLRHIEKNGEKLLSFFYDNPQTGSGKHVVLAAKETIVERPHGHIMLSGSDYYYSTNRLSATSYIYGLFNSHITLGNTSFNKVLSISRNPLNIFKSCGQRIFIKIDNEFKLLGAPSAFEMGFNHCKYYYKLKREILEITVWVSAESPACFLNIKVRGDSRFEFLITNQITAGNNEYDSKPSAEIDEKFKLAEITPDKNELLGKTYPDSRFLILCSSPSDVEKACFDELITESKSQEAYPFITYKTVKVNSFTLALTGILNADGKQQLIDKCLKEMNSFESSCRASEKFWRSLVNNFCLDLPSNKYISNINDMVSWYAHNAMVHFLAPHGLEQYSGAAWGTRDISQGPVEFFTATAKYDILRKVLLEIFSHQYIENGAWPQWFMFDSYRKIQQEESHGDVIVWPLKVLADYILSSGDTAILNEKIPYASAHNAFELTKESYSILDHALKEIKYIKENFIQGTFLSCYGDGDWDDTLQPANSELRKKMVSGWTPILTYQVFLKLAEAFRKAKEDKLGSELESMARSIREDYNKFMIKNGISAGFAYFKSADQVELMLHPSDNLTGIRYRLLPMTRGIISELFTKEQADLHIKTIMEKLYCPDGVRLMDRPAQYIGGPNKYFKRAEQASYIGREISLQYVHAHIRFIEAMAKYGDARELFKSIRTINPIGITEFVKNAEPRQSNSYFSSSDPAFNDRYEAQKNFGKVRTGDVKVKGGWRIYSSGPGIFINQIISNFLGIRFRGDHIEIDPVLPFELDGLAFHFEYRGRKLTFRYTVRNRECAPEKIFINAQELKNLSFIRNPYRKGGLIVPMEVFNKLTYTDKNNLVEIKM